MPGCFFCWCLQISLNFIMESPGIENVYSLSSVLIVNTDVSLLIAAFWIPNREWYSLYGYPYSSSINSWLKLQGCEKIASVVWRFIIQVCCHMNFHLFQVQAVRVYYSPWIFYLGVSNIQYHNFWSSIWAFSWNILGIIKKNKLQQTPTGQMLFFHVIKADLSNSSSPLPLSY